MHKGLTVAEEAVRVVVRVLEPLEVALYWASGVAGHHAVLTHIDSVLETKLVSHLPLGTLAETHDQICNVDKM